MRVSHLYVYYETNLWFFYLLHDKLEIGQGQRTRVSKLQNWCRLCKQESALTVCGEKHAKYFCKIFHRKQFFFSNHIAILLSDKSQIVGVYLGRQECFSGMVIPENYFKIELINIIVVIRLFSYSNRCSSRDYSETLNVGSKILTTFSRLRTGKVVCHVERSRTILEQLAMKKIIGDYFASFQWFSF